MRVQDILHSPIPVVIAGPCSAESEQQIMETADKINWEKVHIFRAGIWKPRTKPGSFEGVGSIGFSWLKKVKEKLSVPIAVEVANAIHAKEALANEVDVLWIGARSTVNPFIVQEIADALKGTDKLVLVKNPVNTDLDLWIGAVERLKQNGIENVGVIHRGFSTFKKLKYRNNPHWQIALEFKEKYPEIPIFIDPSHIAGKRDLICDVAQEALNLEYHGMMIETHIRPDAAWSDSEQQITPDELNQILFKLSIRSRKPSSSDFSKKIANYRKRIDDLDRLLFEYLSQRMEISEKIGQLKKENNMVIYDPERWNQIREHVYQKSADYDLNPSFLEQIMKLIHAESIEVQNRIMNAEK